MKGWVTVLLIAWFTMASVPSHLRWMISEHWYDPEKNLVTIRLDENAADGSDYSCERAARLFHSICRQGFVLRVLPYRVGGFVPSRVNPMTIKWTRYLVNTEDIDP